MLLHILVKADKYAALEGDGRNDEAIQQLLPIGLGRKSAVNAENAACVLVPELSDRRLRQVIGQVELDICALLQLERLREGGGEELTYVDGPAVERDVNGALSCRHSPQSKGRTSGTCGLDRRLTYWVPATGVIHSDKRTRRLFRSTVGSVPPGQ